jgi:hypothetical protein
VGVFGKDHPLTREGALGGWTDPRGIVWLESGPTIVRWDGTTVERHTKALGLPLDNFFDNGIYGEPDGHLYIGSISGLVTFDPRFYSPIPGPPALVGFRASDGQGRPFGRGANLPFRKSGVLFDLKLPLMEGVEDLTVETRLLGLGEAWTPMTGSDLRFPGLAPGHYVLEARATRRDGQSGPVLSFPFRIRRPWYLGGWAVAAWILSLGAAAWGATVWRTRSLERIRDRLERTVTDRTAELLKSNADLTQALSEVKTLSGLVPICCYCKKIRDDDGFWSQLERYIQDRSDAQFSHGICPDCEKRAREELVADRLLPPRSS